MKSVTGVLKSWFDMITGNQITGMNRLGEIIHETRAEKQRGCVTKENFLKAKI